MAITASGATNRGAQAAAEALFRAADPPGITTSFKAALYRYATGTPTPDPDDGVVSEWTANNFEELPAGNGYSDGGVTLERSATGFDVTAEDDTNNRGYVQAKNLVFSASGGSIPGSGTGAVAILITDDAATEADREVFAYLYLGAGIPITISDGGSLTVQDAQFNFNIA